MKKALLGALVVSAVTVAQASAVTIDFTNSAWQPGSPYHTQTVGNTTVTAAPSDDFLTWNNTDGFGVRSGPGGNPEIDPGQVVNVSFASLFTLTSFNVSEISRNERGYYRLDGAGSWFRFDGANNGNQTLIVTLASARTISSIQFGFDPGYDGSSDFSLRSVTGDFNTPAPPTVPEPTSMVLLGTGLLGLVARARRKNNA